MIFDLAAVPFERVAGKLVAADPLIDFREPAGEAAVLPADSVSWQVFRNPVTMFIGGIAAVLLELGEPRVRTAVWQHSSFRRDPAARLRRTGMAAMVTVYGARSMAVAMTARVRAMHARIAGTAPGGAAYRADDPDLLRWVQGTAAWAFMESYRAYVRPVSTRERECYYSEGTGGSGLFGVTDPPGCEADIARMMDDMRPRLEPSPILHELMALVRGAAILPPPFRPMQALVVRAGANLLPPPLRRQLGLERAGDLSLPERLLLRTLAKTADRSVFPTSPAALSCLRLGLPVNYLVRR